MNVNERRASRIRLSQHFANLGRGVGLRDSLFLFSIVGISAAPYLKGLGFYGDDWAFLANMAAAPERGVLSFVQAAGDPRMRPAQLLTLATLFRLFGLEPLGYHVINTALLGVGAVLCYLCIRELDVPRHIAVAVALIFGLLPHYSTDRFWMAAIQATLSLNLYCLSLYADLRSTRGSAHSWGWRSVALAAMVASLFAYEVFLPLFIFNVALTAVLAHRRAHMQSRVLPTPLRLPLFMISTVVVLVAVVVWKASITNRVEAMTIEQRIVYFSWLLKGAVTVAYGEYGIGLPLVVAHILRRYPSAAVSLTALATAVVVFVYMWRMARIPIERGRGAALATSFIAAGFFVFFLSYALFFFTKNAEYSATGINNRIAIASALGVALGWVGGIAAMVASVTRDRLRRFAFPAAVAVAAAVSVLIVGTVGNFWCAAYREEQRILHDIRRTFPHLPSETTFILDGVCPYVGPAIVFESSWDLAGALRIMYEDYGLQADVVTPKLRVERDGLKTLLYNVVVSEYPYRGLVIYHAGLGQHFWIDDADDAKRYFASHNPTRDDGCPPGREGHGVVVF